MTAGCSNLALPRHAPLCLAVLCVMASHKQTRQPAAKRFVARRSGPAARPGRPCICRPGEAGDAAWRPPGAVATPARPAVPSSPRVSAACKMNGPVLFAGPPLLRGAVQGLAPWPGTTRYNHTASALNFSCSLLMSPDLMDSLSIPRPARCSSCAVNRRRRGLGRQRGAVTQGYSLPPPKSPLLPGGPAAMSLPGQT